MAERSATGNHGFKSLRWLHFRQYRSPEQFLGTLGFSWPIFVDIFSGDFGQSAIGITPFVGASIFSAAAFSFGNLIAVPGDLSRQVLYGKWSFIK